MQSLRRAVRARQRTFGFASLEVWGSRELHAAHKESATMAKTGWGCVDWCISRSETKRAAELLADAEGKLDHEARTRSRVLNAGDVLFEAIV